MALLRAATPAARLADPACRGGRYWRYNINHMGMYDISAQLDHIHNIKCAELGAGAARSVRWCLC